MFTQEERDLLIGILESINFKPAAPEAVKLVALIQSILTKIREQ